MCEATGALVCNDVGTGTECDARRGNQALKSVGMRSMKIVMVVSMMSLRPVMVLIMTVIPSLMKDSLR